MTHPLSDLSPAIYDLLKILNKNVPWLDDTMKTHLIRSHAQFHARMEQGLATPEDIAFFHSLTYDVRRGDYQAQVDACRYWLDLDACDRVAKFAFLSRLQKAFLGSEPESEVVCDVFLDRYGATLLPHYEEYGNVIRMSAEIVCGICHKEGHLAKRCDGK